MSLAILQDEGPCIANLNKCGAECCKTVSFIVDPRRTDIVRGMTLKIKALLTDDIRFYYKLHNITTTRDHVIVTLDEFSIEGELLIVRQRCSWLTEELKCSGHPYKKPKICQALTWGPLRKNLRYTPGCVFASER